MATSGHKARRLATVADEAGEVCTVPSPIFALPEELLAQILEALRASTGQVTGGALLEAWRLELAGKAVQQALLTVCRLAATCKEVRRVVHASQAIHQLWGTRAAVELHGMKPIVPSLRRVLGAGCVGLAPVAVGIHYDTSASWSHERFDVACSRFERLQTIRDALAAAIARDTRAQVTDLRLFELKVEPLATCKPLATKRSLRSLLALHPGQNAALRLECHDEAIMSPSGIWLGDLHSGGLVLPISREATVKRACEVSPPPRASFIQPARPDVCACASATKTPSARLLDGSRCLTRRRRWRASSSTCSISARSVVGGYRSTSRSRSDLGCALSSQTPWARQPAHRPPRVRSPRLAQRWTSVRPTNTGARSRSLCASLAWHPSSSTPS